MDTDLIAVIAQLLTGLATLIVASVLIWQMLLQRKLLQIAHSDADNNLSMQAVSEKNAIRRWSAEKINPDMLKKLDDGIKSLNEYELEIYSTQMRCKEIMATTEWRLGRVGGNRNYYKAVFRTMLGGKAGLEHYKTVGRNHFLTANFGDPTLIEIGDEVYEELGGEPL
mgnify:FL=1|tara:strand:+ start:1277 stop:1780 length:504 start_codon:yes stop_codon:yes gene_type:complete